RGREVAAANRDAVARADVRGDDRERQLQLLDGALAVFRAHEAVKEELELLARERALAEADAVARDTELQSRIETVVQLLAPQIHRLASGRVVEHADPVGLAHQR